MLGLFLINDGAALVEAALRADRVRWNRAAALWTVSDLTLFYAIVAASFSGTAIGMFTFWDCHRVGPDRLLVFLIEFKVA